MREIEAVLERISVPFSPVARPSDLFDDPQLNHAGRLLEVDLSDGTGKGTGLPRLPIEVGEHDFGLRLQPPAVGEHGGGILREAGFSEVEIEALVSSGTIRP